MRIEFGDWRLVPVNAPNWELQHRHLPKNADEGAEPKWYGVGRYYQHTTIVNAIEYAADRELAEGNEDAAISLAEFLQQYKDTLERFEAEAKWSLARAAAQIAGMVESE